MARRSKRRQTIDDEGERIAWRRVFRTGIDYLGELRPLGINTPGELAAAAPDAWKRFGRRWLAERRTDIDAYQVQPWALRTFGVVNDDDEFG